MIGDRDFSVNIISKSGTTTEPAIAFRVFKELLEKKYGKGGCGKTNHATTDKEKGALKKILRPRKDMRRLLFLMTLADVFLFLQQSELDPLQSAVQILTA